MLAFIEGTLVSAAMGHAVINVNGLGFRVGIPASTATKLPDPDHTVKLHTYLHMKEDGASLYGFASE